MGECAAAFKIAGNSDLFAAFKKENFVAGNTRDSLAVPEWPEKWIAFMAMSYSDGGTAGILVCGSGSTIQQQYWMREKIEPTDVVTASKGITGYLTASKPWWGMVGASIYKITG